MILFLVLNVVGGETPSLGELCVLFSGKHRTGRKLFLCLLFLNCLQLKLILIPEGHILEWLALNSFSSWEWINIREGLPPISRKAGRGRDRWGTGARAGALGRRLEFEPSHWPPYCLGFLQKGASPWTLRAAPHMEPAFPASRAGGETPWTKRASSRMLTALLGLRAQLPRGFMSLGIPLLPLFLQFFPSYRPSWCKKSHP